jgi:SAM-dependent methyltransferase
MPAKPRLEPAEIMRRVRVEVAKRRGEIAQQGRELSLWRSVVVPNVAKRAFTLPELLAPSDETFVATAYRAVLRREPDQEGLAYYLGMLRTGGMSKVEVLAALRWSPEGKARSVHVDGLLAPFLIQKWQRKPVIGPVISWVHSVLRLGVLSRRQLLLEAAAAREAHGLGDVINDLSREVQFRLEEHEAAHSRKELELSEKIVLLQEQFEQRLHAIDTQIGSLGNLVAQQAATSAQLKDVTLIERRIDHIQSALQAEQEHLARQSNELSSQNAKFGEYRATLEGHGAALSIMEQLKVQALASERALDPLYAAFEEEFRGSRDLVRSRAEPYLEFVSETGFGTADAPVLDLGCGRGEWLELLRDQGLVGKGVDNNHVFIDLCREHGLDVVEGDVIQVMRSLPAQSIGAITGMHIAEHLPFEVLMELLDEAHRLLKPGGLLALETPNPENLQVASLFFYMDPTHRNPLPPEALRWLVEAKGFDQARIERWTVARDMEAPPLLDSDIPGADSINVLLSQLAAAPDYSIIAHRGAA